MNERSIELSSEIQSGIRDHGQRTYPDECCGAMLGSVEGAKHVVSALSEIDNARTDSARNRFLVTDQDYMRVEREAAQSGLSLLGFYHSHPDHPAIPSQYDLDHAMPWFSYVIVAVAKGKAHDLTSWVLAEDRSEFLKEEIVGFPDAFSQGGVS